MTFTGNYYGERITLERISKRQARKLFDAGETVYMQSCKFHPFGMWSQAYSVNKNQDNMIYAPETFDNIVNNFEYYNCSYEQGYYASFYKRIN